MRRRLLLACSAALMLTLVVAAPAAVGSSVGRTAGGAAQAGDVLQTLTVTGEPDTTFVRARLSGTRGRQVALVSGVHRSAPVTLDAVAQSVGLHVPGTVAGSPLQVDVVALGPFGSEDDVEADVAAADGASSTTTTDAGTRLVRLRGEPFVGKGLVYWPAKIGEHWPANTWADPATCQRDARLLSGAGVTLLRIPFEDHEEAVHAGYVACMDAFHANGIAVLWLIGPPTQLEHVEYTPEYADLYHEKNALAVRQVGDHPATAFWTIGNEIERSNAPWQGWLGDETTGQKGMLDGLAERMRAVDGGRHMIGSTICCPLLTGLSRSNVPALDFFGINAYDQPRHPGAAGRWFTDLNAADPRPKILTETGIDRLHCLRGAVAIDNGSGGSVVGTCRTSYQHPTTHSGEDQIAQRDWNGAIWENVSEHLSTPERTDGALFGVTYFMWSDLWWFSLGTLLPSSPGSREAAGVGPWSAPDGIINTEWHGVANAQLPGASERRVTSIAFDRLAEAWSPVAPPRIWDLTAIAVGPTIDVRWRTSEPATTEVQAGPNLEENRDGGDLRSDSTTFRVVAEDDTLRTDHHVVLDLPTADPGLCQKLVVRSFTPDGRSGTMPPLIAGCPSTRRSGTGERISASPQELDLGTVDAGTSTPVQQVTLTNPGDRPLPIKGFTADAPFSVAPGTCSTTVPLAPGASCSIDVGATPVDRGVSGTVTVRSSAAEGDLPVFLSVAIEGEVPAVVPESGLPAAGAAVALAAGVLVARRRRTAL